MTALVSGSLAVKPWKTGEQYSTTNSYTIGATVVTADTIEFDLMPEGVKFVTDFELFGAEIDTNASPTGTIIAGFKGSADTDGVLASKTAGGATQQFFVKGDGAELNTATTATAIVVTVGGTLATAATSGKVFAKVTYICGLDNNG